MKVKISELKEQKVEPAPASKTVINDASTRHVERCLGNLIFTHLLQKTKKYMKKFFTRFTTEDNCDCVSAIDLKPVCYTIEPEKLHTLRTLYNNTKAKKPEESLSECKKNLLNF